VIAQYTTDLSESNQSVHGFLSFTVTQAIFKKGFFSADPKKLKACVFNILDCKNYEHLVCASRYVLSLKQLIPLSTTAWFPEKTSVQRPSESYSLTYRQAASTTTASRCDLP